MNTFITYEKRLQRLYDKNEARSILRLFIEKRYGLSLTDICLGELKNLSKTQSEELQKLYRDWRRANRCNTSWALPTSSAGSLQ